MLLRSLAFHAPLEHFFLTLHTFPGLFCLQNLPVRTTSRLHVYQSWLPVFLYPKFALVCGAGGTGAQLPRWRRCRMPRRGAHPPGVRRDPPIATSV